ncbi:MAG: ankyrin repeat domain-containing protein [Armatimonadetes bacterium]|nr:ankyrin repeat domain-containing protein [Armatimonadota bacterium]
MEFLIASCVDVNATDDEGTTALMIACIRGNAEIARMLIANGADIDQKDHDGLSPIEAAIYNEQFTVARLLIASGCNLSVEQEGFGLMHAAAARGSVRIGRMLQKRGLSLEATDDGGYAPLHWAAQEGQTRFARWLVENGVQLNIEEESGLIPLFIAASEGHRGFVKLLLEAGQDVNYANALGTALHSAFAWDKMAIVDILDRYGARFDVKDEDGRYPIWYAVNYGYKTLVKRYAARYRDILSRAEKTRPIFRGSEFSSLRRW